MITPMPPHPSLPLPCPTAGSGTTPATTATTAPDWRATAQQILDLCATPAHLGWAFRDAQAAVLAEQDQPAAGTAKEPVRQAGSAGTVAPPQDARDDADDDYDPFLGLEDLFEDPSEDDTGFLALARRRNPRAGRVPRIQPLLVALQLARCFGSVAQLRSSLATPGGIVLLATGAAQNDDIAVKMLTAVLSDPLRSGPPAPPLVRTAADAISRGVRSRDQAFAGQSDEMRDALEIGRPIVVVTASTAGLSQDLRTLSAACVQLPALDDALLCEILRTLYPGDRDADTDAGAGIDDAAPDPALAALPALPAADLARLTLEDLILALRAPSAAAAVKRLANTLAPAPASAPRPGLADFPMSAQVRSAVDQLLADLRDWRAGTLPWSAVSRGLLLIGPPGCGKTEIPRLIAAEAGITVHATSLARLQASGARSSDTVREMRDLFTKAAAGAPAIVFIDELDAFGDRARPHDHNSSWTDAIVAGLLECLDGFESLEGIVTIAATNHVDKIDAALRRPGRFDRLLSITAPAPDQLDAAFRWHLAADLAAADLTPIAAAAVGMSGAGIASVVRTARATARAAGRAVSLADLASAIAVTHPPLPAQLRHRIAIHESGHAIVARATGRGRPRMLGIHAAGGWADTGTEAALTDRADIAAALAVLLAGRAAETLVLGAPGSGAGGSSQSDLARATTMAAALEVSWGLGDSVVWRAEPEAAITQLENDPVLRRRVQIHLDRAEATALGILRAYQRQLRILADTLTSRAILAGADLDELLDTVTVRPERACRPRNRHDQSGPAPSNSP